MKTTPVFAVCLLLSGIAAAKDPTQITRNGSQPSVVGSTEHFVGTALIEPVFDRLDERDVSIGKVTFMPGARSHWHSHPRGQTLIVLSGQGWTQAQGGARHVMNAGDVVWCPPGVRHWHGATATTAVTHLAVQQSEGQINVDWHEPVSSEIYLAR